MNILLIDDSLTIVSLVEEILLNEGYKVIVANDGKEGLLKLFRNHVDLIITDLNMPHMDGMEFLKRVRKSPLHKETPVIMLTTESQKEKVVEAISLGISAWVLKPFNNKDFINTIKNIVNN